MANTTVRTKPLVLLITGRGQGDDNRWIKSWQLARDDTQWVELGEWDAPHRNTWVNKLNLAIHYAERPVILVAHDIGCLAVAWWAEYEQPVPNELVAGALLVAPPDVDRPGADPRLAPFGACPRRTLPFPSFVVADRYASQPQLVTSTQLASDWGSSFTLDEIDDRDCAQGQYLLRRLLREPAPLAPVSSTRTDERWLAGHVAYSAA